MIKKYFLSYLNNFGFEVQSKEYDSLAICKRFTKNIKRKVAYYEKEIRFKYNNDIIPCGRVITYKLIEKFDLYDRFRR